MEAITFVETLPVRKVVTRKVVYRGPRGNQRKSMDDIHFIAWDGEGYGDDDHKYVLLANSDGLEIRDLNGLKTERILEAVWSGGISNQHKYVINVMYGANYDFNNWLSDVDFNTAKALHDNYPVRIGDYIVRYNGMWFELEKDHRNVVIWDVWKFWGYGFARALEDNIPDFHGLDIIRKFKALRGAFSEGILDDVAHYNRLELEGLVLLMKGLFNDLADAGIRRPTYLTGSGSLAGAILKQYDVSHYNQQPPPEVMPAINRGYFAGRIEPWKIGMYEGDFYVHDLRSAYPHAMRYLPSMVGEWNKVSGQAIYETQWSERMSIWRVKWNWGNLQNEAPTNRGFPFPWRQDDGTIVFPPNGEGWIWWPEVMAAIETGWKFEVIEGWLFYPEDDEFLPFEWIPELYEKRKVLRDAGKEGAQRLIKFAINSLYGKTCQARGSTADSPPPYHNLAWAGWITSMTRSLIFETAMQNPSSVVYMMTDSVASTCKLDVKEGKDLGEWEIKRGNKALVVQAGVGTVWYNDNPDPRYRGFDMGSINEDAILEAWKDNYRLAGIAANACESFQPNNLKVMTRRPLTLGSAIMTDFDKWNDWVEYPRELDLYGGDGKRVFPYQLHKSRPWLRFYDLEPSGEHIPNADLMGMSHPYQPKWESVRSDEKEIMEGQIARELELVVIEDS